MMTPMLTVFLLSVYCYYLVPFSIIIFCYGVVNVVLCLVYCTCSVLQQLRSLVTVNESLKKQESEFRDSCKVLFTHSLRENLLHLLTLMIVDDHVGALTQFCWATGRESAL